MLYDLAHPSLALTMSGNPLSNLLYSANEGAVDTVFVGGKKIVEHGKLTAMTNEDISKMASQAAAVISGPNVRG